MGTLYDQLPRDYKTVDLGQIDDFLADAVKLASNHGISVADVIAAKHVLELERANGLRVANGDAFDEQIAGIGLILDGIRDALDK
ncbi:MAG: hypothetical protein QM686_02760 [Herbaspirillum sp.]